MVANQLLTVSIFMLTIVGCGGSSSSNPEDVCSDQAWDECADIARRECNLSSTASESALQACRPYVQCEDAAFDACMDEYE